MLRYIILVLLVLNIGLWGWHQGWFSEAPGMEGREPKRLANQKHPEAVEVTKYTAPSTPQQPHLSEGMDVPVEGPDDKGRDGIQNGETPTNSEATQDPDVLSLPRPSASTSCIESGPLNSDQVELFRQSLSEILPENDMWRLDVKQEVTTWSVYVGVFASEEETRKRKSELANIGLNTEMVRGRPQHEPGLSFDIFRSEENAKRRLAEVRNKGAKDAHIIPWREDPSGQLLLVPEATSAQHEQLDVLAKKIGAPAFMACEAQ